MILVKEVTARSYLRPEKGDPPRPLAEPGAGWLAGVDQLSGTIKLLKLGYPSLRLEAELPATFETAPFDLSRPYVAAKCDLNQVLLGGPAGRAPAVLFYQTRTGTSGPTTGGGLADSEGRLLVGVAGPEGSGLTVWDTADLLGSSAPALEDARLLFIESRQEVVLLGRVAGAAAAPGLVAWRLVLADGSWRGPHSLALPSSLSGYTVDYDPVSRAILVFGGQTASSIGTSGDEEPEIVKQSAVYKVDPYSFAVSLLAASGAGAGLARSQAGTYLDAYERRLYVAGGMGPDGPLGDLWELDLYSSTWTLRSGDAGQGPVGMVSPLVFPDPFTGTVWLADFAQGSAEESRTLWRLGRDGAWITALLPGYLAEPAWPVQDSFFASRPARYSFPVDPAEPWPGQLLGAELVAEEPVLDLTIQAASGQLLSEGAGTEADSRMVGAMCPSGSNCYLTARPLPGAAVRDGLSFTLSAWPALLGEEERVRLPQKISAFEVAGSSVVVGTIKGLRFYGASTPLELLSELPMCCGEHVTGIVRCGTALCVSRHGRAGGLVAVYIADPSQPALLGRADTKGHAADLAVWGLTAYVAEAHQGVGLYDVSQPDAILEVDRLHPGGKIVALAAQSGLLAVANDEQSLRLYDLGNGHAPLGQLTTSHRASRLRLFDRQLWVLDEEGTSVQVLDLTDPGQPLDLGEHTADAAGHFFRRFSGDLAITIDGKALKASRLERAW